MAHMVIASLFLAVHLPPGSNKNMIAYKSHYEQ